MSCQNHGLAVVLSFTWRKHRNIFTTSGVLHLHHAQVLTWTQVWDTIVKFRMLNWSWRMKTQCPLPEHQAVCKQDRLVIVLLLHSSIKSFSPCTISLDLFPSSSNSPILATVVSGTVYPPAFGIRAQNIQVSQKSILINTVDTTSQTLLYSVMQWSGINSRKASALSSPAQLWPGV